MHHLCYSVDVPYEGKLRASTVADYGLLFVHTFSCITFRARNLHTASESFTRRKKLAHTAKKIFLSGLAVQGATGEKI
jgi:hypothetical protein